MRYLLCGAVIALGACGGGVHGSLGGGARAPKGPATSAEAEARRPVGPIVEERGAAGAREEREEVIAYLVGVAHAEPHRHEIAAEHERRELERRLMSDAERAARREADALQTRARVRIYLVALGAKERPPRPAPLPEEPGEPPLEGAVWGPGGWAWRDGQWAWIPGSWREPRDHGDHGSDDLAGLDLALGILGAVLGDGDGDGDGGARRRSASIEGGVRDHRRGTGDPIVRDHRAGKRDDAAPIVRDHRAGRTSEPVIRDHRENKPPAPSPIVRDHRESARDQAPVVRDHRDSKKDDDDRKSVTRDHRR